VICVLGDGPHLVNGSPKPITASQSSYSRSPLQRQALDCCDRTGIAPIIRVEAALFAPLDAHIRNSALLAGACPTFPVVGDTRALADIELLIDHVTWEPLGRIRNPAVDFSMPAWAERPAREQSR
jgi:hypothetical protein